MKTRLLPALAQVQIQKQRDVREDLIRGIKIIENRRGLRTCGKCNRLVLCSNYLCKVNFLLLFIVLCKFVVTEFLRSDYEKFDVFT